MCWAFVSSPDTCPLNITVMDICPQHKTSEYMSAMVVLGGWAGVGVGQMSDHTWCLGICMCRDKISCRRRQLNGGCIETALDRGLHLPHTTTAEHEIQGGRRGVVVSGVRQ